MNIRIVNGLPFVSIEITQDDKMVKFENVLLDTGSGSSIFSAYLLDQSGIRPKYDAVVRQVVGIGGSESVVEVEVENIRTDSLSLTNFIIESGSVNYGFGFDGILGFDFLQATQAVIDLGKMEIRQG